MVSALLFGGATPASKALLGDVEAQALAGLLYLGAALGVLPVVMGERNFRWPWHTGRHTLLLLAGAVLLGGILGPLLLLLGLKSASSGSVSLWLNLELVATALLGHFVFQEHLSRRAWIAAGGTLIAAMLLAGSDASGFLPGLLVFLGCVCWGFDNHFIALIDGISPAQTTLWKGSVAGMFNLVLGGAVAGGIGSPGVVIVALLVGAVSYGCSITLYVMAAQGLGAVRSQMIFSVAPFFGLLLSVTVLGEAFTHVQAVAALLILVSLIVLFRERHVHGHCHVAMSHQHRHSHDGLHHNHGHEGIRPKESHVHWHDHAPEEHAHKHWPDLHHRHDHEKEQQ